MADLANLRISVDSREVKSAISDLNNLSRASDGAERAASKLSSAAKLFGGALAAVGILGLAADVARANAEFQSLNASLKVATGSSAAATAAFNEIRKFAAETPYQLNQTVEAFLKLKNLGLDPSMASLRSYGNTAASMGKGLNQMIEAVADASTMEFERLKEFGIKAKQQKDTVTFTFQGIATTVRKNSEEIQQYLINIGNTKFAGAMDEQMKTLNGQLSNLRDNIDNFYVTLGNSGATNVFSQALNAASNAVVYLTNNLDKILRAVEITLVAVAGMAAAFIAFRAALGAQALIAYIAQLVAAQFALGATTTAAALAGAGIRGLTAALASSGWGIALVAVGALTAAMYSLATAQANAMARTNDLISSLKVMAQTRAAGFSQARGQLEIEARLLDRDIGRLKEKQKLVQGGANEASFFTKEIRKKQERLDAIRIGTAEADAAKKTADAMAAIAVPAATAAVSIAEVGKKTKKTTDALLDYYNGLVETGRYLGLTTEYEKQAAKATDDGRIALAAKIMTQGKANEAAQLLLDNEKKRQEFTKGTLADLLFENTLIGLGVKEREKAIAVRALENAMLASTSVEYQKYLAAVATGSEGKVLDDQKNRVDALREEVELMRLAPEAAAARAAALEAERLGLVANTDAYKAFLAAAAEATALKKTRDALKEIADAMKEVKDMTFDIDLEGVFGSVGKAVGGLINVYDDFAERQKKLATAMKKEGKTDAERAMLQQKSIRNEVNLYGNLAASAKGFFKEKSTGYKVMQAAEMAFRAFEFAMSVKSIAMKATETAATVVAEGTKTAAQTASGASKMFSQLGVWAFPIVAAMIAVMASLGGKGGSSASPSIPSAEDMQAAQGAGGVLGDSTAKSDSINRALEIMASNSNSDLEYSNQMVQSLRSIQSNMANLSNNVAKQISVSGGMFDTSNQGLGSTGSGGFLGIGASSTTRELYDLGIDIVSSSIAEIIAGGISGNTYQVIQQVKKKSGFFGIGGGTKTSYQTTTGSIDQDVRNSITDVIASLRQGLIDGADAIGLQGAQAILDAFEVNIGRISLSGLTGQEIEEQLNAVFSKVGDQMAGALLPSLIEMQRIGEGLFETFARVAREYQVVDVALRSIGKEFGAVGIASIEARSALVGMFESLDQFVEQTNFFRDNFLTEAEQIAPVANAVADELKRLGLASIATVEQFKNTVLGLDLTTAAGQETYAALLQLAPAFKKVADYQKELTELSTDSAKALSKFTDQMEAIKKQQESAINTLRGAVGRLAKEASDAEQNLRKVYSAEMSKLDAIIGARSAAVTAVQQAYAREADVFRDAANNFRALGASIRSFASGIFGELIGPSSKLEQARQGFINLVDAARGGSRSALEAIPSAGAQLTDVIAATATSRTDMLRQLLAVNALTQEAALYADEQASIAELQLEKLEKQFDVLTELLGVSREAAASNVTFANAVTALLSADKASTIAEVQKQLITQQIGTIIDLTESTDTLAQAISKVDDARSNLTAVREAIEAAGLSQYIEEIKKTGIREAAEAMVGLEQALEAEIDLRASAMPEIVAAYDKAQAAIKEVQSATEKRIAAYDEQMTKRAGELQQTYRELREEEAKNMAEAVATVTDSADAKIAAVTDAFTKIAALYDLKIAEVRLQTEISANAMRDAADRLFSASELLSAPKDAEPLNLDPLMMAANDNAIGIINALSPLEIELAAVREAIAALAAAPQPPAPVVNVAGTVVNIGDTVVNVPPTTINVLPTDVTVNPTDVKINQTIVNENKTTVDIMPSTINIAGTTVNISPPVVNVAAPIVNIKFDAPIINVPVTINNAISTVVTATKDAVQATTTAASTASVDSANAAAANVTAATTTAANTVDPAISQISESSTVKTDFLTRPTITWSAYSSNLSLGSRQDFATGANTDEYAMGGMHGGGWRLVGENGPELEYTGPSRIYNNGQTSEMLNNGELVAEVKYLREELRNAMFQVAKNTGKSYDMLNRWNGNGLPETRDVAA